MSKGRQDRKKEGKTSTNKETYMYKKKHLKLKLAWTIQTFIKTE